MAKTKGPLLSLDATGTINDSITFRKKLPGHTASKYSKPGSKVPFESSPRQKDQRSIIRLITIRWQCMSSSDKLSWETAAKKNRFKGTGYHYFLHKAKTDLTKYLGLVGYWSMNYHVGELVYDLSGNKNHGTLSPSYPTNCPVFVDSINKKLGKALLFDGIDDYVEVPHHVSLNITETITLEAIIKGNLAGEKMLLSNLKAGVALGGYNIEFGGNKIRFILRKSDNSDICDLLSLTKLTSYQCYHVAGTYDGSIAKVYLNGVEDNSVSASGLIGTPSDPIFIGHSNGYERAFDGLIDEVRIYNRVLSEEEFKKHYSL